MSENKHEDRIGKGLEDANSPERVRARSMLAKTLSDAGYDDVLVLSHETAEETLTPNRREIIQALTRTNVESVRELADVLERDYGNVSRDLGALVRSNIVGYVETGTSKRPVLEHETVIVEPLVTSDPPLDR
ncbi:ArsR family transcriptional regulator [Halovenus marina]|uniref:HVO_A0114 family putative DNA-binding protein n=1 Tax=Halovenus marina TaxID=3396621 RepID=UPI003F54C7E2